MPNEILLLGITGNDGRLPVKIGGYDRTRN